MTTKLIDASGKMWVVLPFHETEEMEDASWDGYEAMCSSAPDFEWPTDDLDAIACDLYISLPNSTVNRRFADGVRWLINRLQARKE